MSNNNTPKIHFINAGAGSGKTTRLVSLFCEHLLGQEVSLATKTVVPDTQREVIPAERILLTTFTRAAAGEFKDRIKYILLKNGASDLVSSVDSAMIGTIDSICQQYIQKYWYLLDLSPDLAVKDQKEQHDILKELLDKESIATEQDRNFFWDYREKFELKVKQDNSMRDYYDFWKDNVISLVDTMELYALPFTKLQDIHQSSLDTARTVMDPDLTCEDTVDLTMYDKDTVECIDRIFAVAERLLKEYEDYKVENNLLTYQDLEVKFLDLLDLPSVKEDLINSLSCLMVDEFQDISPIQLKIYQKLSSLLPQTYWVGDPKQAIYGFRGSDTQLVNSVIRSFPSISSNTQFTEGQVYVTPEQLLNGKLCETEYLTTSYRSLPALVDKISDVFINAFSPAVMGVDSTEVLSPQQVKLIPWETKLLPLQSQLGQVCGGKFIHHLWQTNLTKKGEESPDAKSYSVMHQALAEYIKSTVADPSFPLHKVADREIGAIREITYGDIAILAKSNSKCERIGKVLTEHGVPVSISQKDILDQIEVRLVLAFLKFIYGDEINLVRAEINKLWEDMSLEENLASFAGDTSVSDIFVALDKFRTEYQYNSIYHTLKELISYFDLYNYVAKWNFSTTRKNNLKSLLQYAEQYSQRNSTSIMDFVEFVQETEIKADFDNSGNSVKVLTYHKAKGLEWKVVILDDLYSDWEANFNEKHITGVKKTCDQAGNTVINYFPPVDKISKLVLDNCKATDLKLYNDCRNKARAEEIRLLYVGLTRAENHIIIPSFGAVDLKLISSLGLTIDELAPKREPFPAASMMPQTSGVNLISSIKPGVMVDAPNRRLTPSTAEKELDSGNLSVSEVKPLSDKIDVSQLTGDIAETDKGTCIHNFMAAYRWNGLAKTVENHDRNLRLATRILKNFSMDQAVKAEELVAAADSIFTVFVNTYGSQLSFEREVSFKHYLEDDRVVDGEIDLLVGLGEKELKKQYVIVDYKNVTKEPEDLEKHTQGYFSQLSYYRKAVLKAEPGSEVVAMYICYPTLGKMVKIQTK